MTPTLGTSTPVWDGVARLGIDPGIFALWQYEIEELIACQQAITVPCSPAVDVFLEVPRTVALPLPVIAALGLAAVHWAFARRAIVSGLTPPKKRSTPVAAVAATWCSAWRSVRCWLRSGRRGGSE